METSFYPNDIVCWLDNINLYSSTGTTRLSMM